MKDNIFIISQISDDISVICFVGYGDNDLFVSFFPMRLVSNLQNQNYV